MKKTVLVFGVISGVIATLLMVATVPFMHKLGDNTGWIVGYTGLVISFSLVFFGIRSYRDNVGGGQITFARGFAVGILISLITSLFYVVTWEIIYFNFLPGFLDSMNQAALQKLIASGATQDAIKKSVEETNKFMQMYNNPFFCALITFCEPFPVGLIVTLISAIVLRRRQPRAQASVPVNA